MLLRVSFTRLVNSGTPLIMQINVLFDKKWTRGERNGYSDRDPVAVIASNSLGSSLLYGSTIASKFAALVVKIVKGRPSIQKAAQQGGRQTRPTVTSPPESP